MFGSAMIQGSSHHKCDDYAIDVPRGVVVCDGCSGAKFGDIASRTVAYVATRLINEHSMQDDATKYFSGAKVLAEQCIASAFRTSSLLHNINEGILDTTLLYIVQNEHNDGVWYSMLGDGHVVAKMKGGTCFHTSVSFSKNMPMYVSYLAHPSLMQAWKDAKQDRIVSHITTDPGKELPVRGNSDILNYILSHSEHASFKAYDRVAIFTDGIETFPCDKQVWELAEELIDFKLLSSGFAQRRLNAVIKKYGTPSDDLSMGVWINDN